MDDASSFHDGRRFVEAEGRLVERRLLATLFDGSPPDGVVDSLRGYRNDDGGFGHGLEPDKRCPGSLPADVEVAVRTMGVAGGHDDAVLAGACDYLVTVADADGAVALADPAIEAHPRAVHWGEWTYVPGLLPTAGLVAALTTLGVHHPWVERARAWCWRAIADELPAEGHVLADVAAFLAAHPDDPRTAAAVARVADRLSVASSWRGDAKDPAYGVTPLELAPTPTSPWAEVFGSTVLDGHLDRLEADQADDGGWTITWEPPGVAAALEWRGIETVRALRVLRAYGRR